MAKTVVATKSGTEIDGLFVWAHWVLPSNRAPWSRMMAPLRGPTEVAAAEVDADASVGAVGSDPPLRLHWNPDLDCRHGSRAVYDAGAVPRASSCRAGWRGRPIGG